jgi:hypothetical protein
MNPLIGPELEYGFGCGYSIRSSTGETTCGRQPVVRHFLFDYRDEEDLQPCGFACEQHVDIVPPEVIYMYHPVGIFCQDPKSAWSFDTNECTVTIADFEMALFGTTELGLDIVREFEQNDTK